MDASRGLDSTHEACFTDDAWIRGHHKQGNSSLVCARCGVTYMRLGSLVRHTRRHHKDSKVAQIRLEDGSLLFHDMGDREFQCPHCPLKSTQRGGLSRHIKAAHGYSEQESRRNALKYACEESSSHLLECPALRELRISCGLEELSREKQ
ncbi:Tvingi protein, partial [Trypanosoma conorhini]